jgi:hypothetical protein
MLAGVPHVQVDCNRGQQRLQDVHARAGEMKRNNKVLVLQVRLSAVQLLSVATAACTMGHGPPAPATVCEHFPT